MSFPEQWKKEEESSHCEPEKTFMTELEGAKEFRTNE